MSPFARWSSILGLVAILLGATPTWRTDDFFEIKRVRVLSIGAFQAPVLRVRDVFVPVARGATDWARLDRRLDWDPLGSSAIALAAGCILLGAAAVARRRSTPGTARRSG